MRPGGGRSKGARFETDTCAALSLWISSGARADLFMRNTLSGGRFTIVARQGSKEHGQPGDVMAAHPLAFDFLSLFLVECKHVQALDLDGFLFDYRGRSFLGKVWTLAEQQARTSGRRPIIVARQNRRPVITLMDAGIGYIARDTAKPQAAFRYHILDNQRLLLTTLADLTRLVSASAFLSALREFPTISR